MSLDHPATDRPFVVFACFRPRSPEARAEMFTLMGAHHELLRELGHATNRPSMVLDSTSGEGLVVEVFEWASAAACEAAHEDPRVRKLWDRYEQLSEFAPLRDAEDADKSFVHWMARG